MNTHIIKKHTHTIKKHTLAKTLGLIFSIAYGFMIPRIIQNSIHIFTDSKYVKNDISTHFNISSDKITYGYGDAADIFKNSLCPHKSLMT